MSNMAKRDRKSFRPTFDGLLLEKQVVMSGATVQVTMLRAAGVPAPAPVGTGTLTARQLLTAYRQQFQAIHAALKQYVNDQVATLYSSANLGANGRPTQQALSSFSNNVSGALNATSLGLSSQASLLPGSGRLVSNLQQSLVGDRANSLARLVDSGRATRSQAFLQNSLDRQINSPLSSSSSQVSNYLRFRPLNRLSVDQATGQRVSLSQYVGDQAARQINSSFGASANSVGANARSSHFDSTGAFNSQAVGAFQQQYGNALNTAAYQANSLLSILPNSSPVRSQLQSSFFGTGDGTGSGIGTGNVNLSTRCRVPSPRTRGRPRLRSGRMRSIRRSRTDSPTPIRTSWGPSTPS